MRRRTFLRRAAEGVLGVGILRHAAACDRPPPAAAGADTRLAALRDRYFLRHLELNPVTSTYLGGDGYSAALRDANGRLRDFRPEALDAERRFYHGLRSELAEVQPDALSPPYRIDHGVLGAQLGFLVHQLDELRYYERAVDSYVAEPFRGVDWQLQQMQDAGSGLLGTPEEWELVIARVGAIPAYLEAAKANLAAGKKANNIPDRRMVRRDGIDGSRANAEYFRVALGASARQYLGAGPFASQVVGRLDPIAARAADAYDAFAAWLAQSFDENERVDRFAIGPVEYEWRVHNNLRDPRTTEQLYQFGLEEVARYEEKIFEVAPLVARQARLPVTWDSDGARRQGVRAVIDYLGTDSPRDDEELFRWYREVGERAVSYGRERDLFDIPQTYHLDIVPTPPVLRSTIDAAYYAAPPFKRSGVGRFYLTPTGNDPAALRLNNRASVADTAVHEGFPGHDWHYKYMTQHARDISNVRWGTPGGVEDSSSMWEDSMATEGWALYSEELMADPAPGRAHGFYTPSEYLYQLQGQLLRAVRIPVDVGLHTGRMTFDEARDYFTEHVEFFPNACAKAASDASARAVCGTATRAIYRYSKWPTQAITYNLGKNAIVDLREAYKTARGPAYSTKDFHERFMRMGTIPVGYFRETFLTSPSG